MRLSNILAIVFAISTAVLSWLYFGSNPGANSSGATSSGVNSSKSGSSGSSSSDGNEEDLCCKKIERIRKLAQAHMSQNKDKRAAMDTAFTGKYIRNYYMNSPAFKAMKNDSIKSIYFDAKVLANFGELLIDEKIDGIRAYLAHYTGEESDPDAKEKKYTIILVGTKEGNDVFIKADNSDKTRSVQNYGDPCLPTCAGATFDRKP